MWGQSVSVRRLAAIITAALALGFGGVALAQGTPVPIDPELLEKIRKSNAECYSCHTEAAVQKPPRTDMDLTKLRTLLLEEADFKPSGHGRMECKTCHGASYAVFPHAEGARAKISPCEECHAAKVMKVETQYHASVHLKEKISKFTCQSCHDPHLFNIAAKLGSPKVIVAQDNGMCLDCHQSEERYRTMAPADKKRPDLERIHKWLPNARLHWTAVRCIDCHTPATKVLSHEVLNKDKAERNCVTCHSRESSLRTRLYRHLVAAEQEQMGFANSVILSNSYVIGATRNPVVDWTIIGLGLATAGGMLGHGALRIVLALLRRRGK
jgi:predicted CXXCH cytochrome family protein